MIFSSSVHLLVKEIPRIMKTILNNRRTSGRITIPVLKLYYRAIVIKSGIGTKTGK